MHGAIAERAPAIVGASVEATRRNLPGMMRDSHVRTL
jgi:hypothetical protein